MADDNTSHLFLLKKPRDSFHSYHIDRSERDGFSFVNSDGRKLQTLQVLDAPYGCEEVLCFCDGLLLVTRFSSRRLALWNPSTRMVEKLWLPYSCHGSSFGLCRDPVTDDFKVVISDYYYYTVYSCKNNSWKKKLTYECIKYFAPEYDYRLFRGPPGVCVDGSSYWVLRDSKQIIYFDSRDDKFKILQKPKIIEDDKDIYLVDLRGRLGLYCNGRDETRVKIWTKEKGIDDDSSWKMLITIRNVDTPIRSFVPHCFVGNKILIRIQRIEDDGLVVYNSSKNRFKELKDTTEAFGVAFVPYVDNTFFPIEKRTPKRKHNG